MIGSFFGQDRYVVFEYLETKIKNVLLERPER